MRAVAARSRRIFCNSQRPPLQPRSLSSPPCAALSPLPLHCLVFLLLFLTRSQGSRFEGCAAVAISSMTGTHLSLAIAAVPRCCVSADRVHLSCHIVACPSAAGAPRDFLECLCASISLRVTFSLAAPSSVARPLNALVAVGCCVLFACAVGCSRLAWSAQGNSGTEPPRSPQQQETGTLHDASTLWPLTEPALISPTPAFQHSLCSTARTAASRMRAAAESSSASLAASSSSPPPAGFDDSARPAASADSSRSAAAVNSSQPAASANSAAVIRMPNASHIAAGAPADPFRDMQQMARSSASAASSSSNSSAPDPHGALHRSLQALSDTLAHAQSTQREQERIMQQKLQAKGKKIAGGSAAAADASPSPPAACATSSSVGARDVASSTPSPPSSSSAPAPPPSKIVRIGNSKLRRAVRFAGVDEGDEDEQRSSDDEKDKPTHTVPAAACSSSSAGAVSSASSASASRASMSDFDAFLAAQWCTNLSSSSAASVKADAPAAAAAVAIDPDQPPSSIAVNPVALSAFLHFRAPLPAPRIPSLQHLCCSALSSLAQNYSLADRAEFHDLSSLPSQMLEACIEGVKRPRVIEAGSAAAVAAEAAAALLDPDPLDRARNVRAGLQDSQLLPFLVPQLDSFALEAEGADAIGGGIAGLPDSLAWQISPTLLDRLTERCKELQHLNLAGYTHAFTAGQLSALSQLGKQLVSLNLSHCKMLGGEVEVLLQNMVSLSSLNLSWTSFVTEESPAPLPALAALLARPALRGSLRSLKVDGLRADPNELLWRVMEMLGSQLEELSMDSVSAPVVTLTREQEEANRKHARLAAAEAAAVEQLDCEKAAAAIEQLQSENAKLKTTFEMQLRMQREAAAAQQQPEPTSSAAPGRFPAFHTLSAIASDRLSSESLLLLVSTAPNLTSLTLKGAALLSSPVVQALARGCRFLQHLNVADCQAIDDQALWALREAAEPRVAAGRRNAGKSQAPGSAIADDECEEQEEVEQKHDGGDASPTAEAALSAPASSSCPPVLGSFLRSVDLSWDENLSNAAIGALFDARSCADPWNYGPTATVSAVPYCPLARPDAAQGTSRVAFGLERVVLSCLEDLDEATVAKLAKHHKLRELDLSRCLGLNASAMLQAEGDEEDPSLADNLGGSSSSSSSASLNPSPSLLPPAWSFLQKLNLSWTAVTNSDLGLVARRCPRLQSLNVEGCKHLNDAGVDEMLSAESDGCCVLYNLSFVSFFFVNALTLRGIVALLAAQSGRGYWLSIKDYYGDMHDPSTLAQDALEAKSSSYK